MKILVLVPSLDEKGPIIVAKNLASSSKDNEIEYVFLSLRKNEKKLLEYYLNQNINVVEADMGKVPLPNNIIKLKKIINKINPDIIHSHAFWPTIIAGFFIPKYKKVVTVHNNPHEDYSYEYGNIVGKLMTKFFIRALKYYEVVVPISNFVKTNIKVSNQSKIEVIYNGIEDKFTKFNHNRDQSTINLITVSVLNKRKNVKRILEIIYLLKQDGKKVKCNIIGDGKEMLALKEYVKLHNLNNEVTFLGKIPRKSVFEYILNADAFIFTSKSEGFGLVVAESYMMGKPVLVNDIPVMWEIVDNNTNGFILRSNSQFLDAISSLYNFEIKEKMSLSAREKYLKYFTIDKMVKRYEKLFYELMVNK